MTRTVLGSLQTGGFQCVDQLPAGYLALAGELNSDRLLLRIERDLRNALDFAESGRGLLARRLVLNAGDAQDEGPAVLHVPAHHVWRGQHRAGDLLGRNDVLPELD